MARLSRAGFRGDFVRPAILPEWWDESCTEDTSLLPDVEIRVARFLGVALSLIRNPDRKLAAPTYPNAKLRRVRDVSADRLAPAIHAALEIAGAVVRCMPEATPPAKPPPVDGLAWRDRLHRPGSPVTLNDILNDLWGRGIPVVPLELLPSPSFQGLACMVDGRPVIMLGHKHDEPGRVAFCIAYETYHIAAGDCLPEQPVVDEDEEIEDDADIEQNADRYAIQLLVGDDEFPAIEGADFKDLANKALELERSRGADASSVLFSWARQTGEYDKASLAVKALYRHTGARRALREHFDRHVDIEPRRRATALFSAACTATKSAMKLLVDSDAFCKIGAAGMLRDTAGILGAQLDECARLPALPHMLRRGRLRTMYGASACDGLIPLATELTIVPRPSDAWLDKLTPIQAIDPGEALIFAAAAEAGSIVLTGDKRALRALKDVEGFADALMGVWRLPGGSAAIAPPGVHTALQTPCSPSPGGTVI